MLARVWGPASGGLGKSNHKCTLFRKHMFVKCNYLCYQRPILRSLEIPKNIAQEVVLDDTLALHEHQYFHFEAIVRLSHWYFLLEYVAFSQVATHMAMHGH